MLSKHLKEHSIENASVYKVTQVTAAFRLNTFLKFVKLPVYLLCLFYNHSKYFCDIDEV